MIVSIVLVSHAAGGILFARHYGAALRTELSQAEWLRRLRDATAPDWALLSSDGAEEVATVGEVQVVYSRLGDVVALLAGTDEHDALLLLELSRALTTALRGAVGLPAAKTADGRVSAERRILQRYADLCLVVDELVDDGDVDHTDAAVIQKLVRMRPTK